MKPAEWKKLRDLLRSQINDSMAQSCLKALLNPGSAGILPSGAPDTASVLNICVNRADPDFADENTTEGYGAVIPALKMERSKRIYLYMVVGEDEWYTVVTNTSTSRLIGILRHPSDGVFLNSLRNSALPKYITDQEKLSLMQTSPK